jgi:hypothetical protein
MVMLMSFAEWAVEPTKQADLLQCSLTFLLGAVELLELSQGDAFLDLDRAADNGINGGYVSVHN